MKILALVVGGALAATGFVSAPASAGQPCEAGSPRVFKLEPSAELNAMMPSLLGPTDLISSPAGLSVVIVAVPLPCGEQLTRVSVEVWDGYVVLQRSRGKRMLRAVADHVRGARLPWLSDFLPQGQTRKMLRLERSAKLGKGLSWIGNFNDHGVVMFPVACNSVTGATLKIRTEREVLTTSGRFKRRRRTQEITTVRIPAPTQPPDDLQALHDLLDWRGAP